MRYLVETMFKQPPTPELLALLPQETARGNELTAQGLREHLFVAADLSKAWQIYAVDSPQMLQTLLESFPLYPYVANTITVLADEAPET